MLKYIFALWLLLAAAPTVTWAQATTETTTVPATAETATSDVEMASTLRRDGKIYVVVAVILTILGGLLFYLIRLDRKVSKLEQQLKS